MKTNFKLLNFYLTNLEILLLGHISRMPPVIRRNYLRQHRRIANNPKIERMIYVRNIRSIEGSE